MASHNKTITVVNDPTALTMLKRTLSNSMLDLAAVSSANSVAIHPTKLLGGFDDRSASRPMPLYRTGSDCSIFNSTAVNIKTYSFLKSLSIFGKKNLNLIDLIVLK